MEDLHRTALLIASALFGACLGSFLNVCIYRLPRESLSVSSPPRSFCPSCGNRIRWGDNIPLLSWIVLGGRCRFCHAPISMRYLLVEALTGVLFATVAARQLAQSPLSLAAWAVMTLFVAALVVASFIDWDLRIIPDEITIGGMIVAPLAALAVPELHSRPVDGSVSWLLVALVEPVERVAAVLPGGLREGPLAILLAAVLALAGGAAGLYGYAGYWRITRGSWRPLRTGALAAALGALAAATATLCVLRPELLLSVRVQSLAAALAGMLAGSSLVLLVGVVGTRIFRKPAMGFGDVKLMGLLGAFTGWAGVLLGFFVACLAGSVVGIFLLVRYRNRYLPFGPFLALGCLTVLLWPEALQAAMDWYRGLF